MGKNVIKYRGIPVYFEKDRHRTIGGVYVEEYVARYDSGTPVDRFDLFAAGPLSPKTAWTGDTLSKDIKKLRKDFCAACQAELTDFN